MTTFNYGRSRSTAERLLAKFGQTGAIRRVTSGGSPWDPIQTTTDHACTLVDMNYEAGVIDGSRIQDGDRKIYLSTASLAIEPTVADRIIIGGAEHAIVTIKPLAPGGTVVFHEIQARRS